MFKFAILSGFSLNFDGGFFSRPIKIETKARLNCKLEHMSDLLDSLFQTLLLPPRANFSNYVPFEVKFSRLSGIDYKKRLPARFMKNACLQSIPESLEDLTREGT